MKQMLFTIGFFLGFSFLAPNASAQQYESEKLFSKVAWSVEVTYDSSDAEFWCDATTINRNSQALSVVAYDSDVLALFVFDQAWSLRPRAVRFVIDIDRSRWEIDGQSQESSVSVTMNDVEKTTRFLRQLQRGNSVAVYNEKLSRLATFSLSGSSAAITALFDCWNKISKQKDPFGTSDDPF